MSVEYRLTIDQQHELAAILCHSLLPGKYFEDESGWKPNLKTIRTQFWTDKRQFDRVVHALNKETTRMWLYHTVALLSEEEFYACRMQAFCDPNLRIMSQEVSHDQLFYLKRLVTEKLELAACAKPGIPITEETRLVLVRLYQEQESCVREHYVKLVQFFWDHFQTPTNNIGENWRVSFHNEADLKCFQEKVNEVERQLLTVQIWQAFRECEYHRRDELQKPVRTHFGSITNEPFWWTNPWISLVDLRFYLAMLREPDLDKVKAMVRDASNYAMAQEEGEEPDPAPVEPEMTNKEKLKLWRMAERKARFLHTVAKQPALIGALASYMDEDKLLTMEGIARKVANNDDSVKFDEWESIASKADPGHIVWKIVDRDLSEDDKGVLIGLVSLTSKSSGRPVGWYILYSWSTFTDEKKELVNAYLDLIPEKNEAARVGLVPINF